MAQERISQLPTLDLGVPFSGGAMVPISQFQYGTTGTLTTFRVSANQFAAIALSGVTGVGFIAYTGGGYVNRTFTGGAGIYVNNGDGSADPSWNLMNTAVVPGTYGTVTSIPSVTVDQTGRITSATNIGFSAGGTVVEISTGFGLTGGPITYSGTVAVDPVQVATTTGVQTIINKTLSGDTITGGTINNVPIGGTLSSTGSFSTAQVITLSFGDGSSMTTAAGMGSVTFLGTQSGITGGPVTTSGTIGLAPSGVVAATYGSASAIPVITIDGFGRTTSATTVAVPAGFTWTGLTTSSTVSASYGYFVNTASGVITMTLPTVSAGNYLAFTDAAGTFNSNPLTITTAGGEPIMSLNQAMTVNTQYAAASLVYAGPTNGWRLA